MTQEQQSERDRKFAEGWQEYCNVSGERETFKAERDAARQENAELRGAIKAKDEIIGRQVVQIASLQNAVATYNVHARNNSHAMNDIGRVMQNAAAQGALPQPQGQPALQLQRPTAAPLAPNGGHLKVSEFAGRDERPDLPYDQVVRA